MSTATIQEQFVSFSSNQTNLNEKPEKVILDDIEFHVKEFNIKDTYFFNPYDVKSVASAIYLKHKGCQVRDVTANNTDVFQTNFTGKWSSDLCLSQSYQQCVSVSR